MSTTETLDKLYLEWSQFTSARTGRELMLDKVIGSLTLALMEIRTSNANNFDDPIAHVDWCVERARAALDEAAQ